MQAKQHHGCGVLIGIVVSVSTFFLATPVRVTAQDMDKTIEDRLKKATVQVWMCEGTGPGHKGMEGGQREGDPNKKDSEDPTAAMKPMAVGSGSFINRTGLVVTNNHVVDMGHEKSPLEKFKIRNDLNVLVYKVSLNSGTPDEKEYKGDVLYQNEAADLALVQVYDKDGELLSTPNFVPRLPTSNVATGDRIWCFGFPGGDLMATSKDKHARVTITAGNILNMHRRPSGRVGWIDTDVMGGHGNSGGPLVNQDGKMIGVLSQGRLASNTSDSESGVVIRIIPADLVADVVKVALALDRIKKNTDLEPFLQLLTEKNGRVFLPGMERDAEKLAMKSSNGDEVIGTLADEELKWATPLGEISAPADLAAYVINKDGFANLLLDGGDRLSGDAKKVTLKVKTVRDRVVDYSMASVDSVRFRKPRKELPIPNVEGVLIDGDNNRLLLTDIQGEVVFQSETGPINLKVDEIIRIETKEGKQVVRTEEGSSYSGHFSPQTFSAKMAWSGKPVQLSLVNLQNASIQRSNPARSGLSRQSLAQRLSIDDEGLKEIAHEIESGHLEKAGDMLNQKSEKASFKALPGPMQDQVKALLGEYELRSGKFADALNEFKKLKRADIEMVKWFAEGRFYVLDQCPDGNYKGKTLKDAEVFVQAAEDFASRIVGAARDTNRSYQKISLKDHSDWDSLIKKLSKHESELQIANGMDPGDGENDVFRTWRFRQNINFEERLRLETENIEISRQIEDIKTKRMSNRDARDKTEALVRKIEKLQKSIKETERALEDTYMMMREGGFRLDDPAATDIIN